MVDYNKFSNTFGCIAEKLTPKPINNTTIFDFTNELELDTTIEFVENVKEEEYKAFTNNHKKSHFLQSYEWGQFCFKIKKQIPHYVGLKNNKGKLIATALLLEKKLPFGYSYMYSPRGLITDYSNKTYLKVFTTYLKKYLKKNNVIYCKFDPDIKYQDIDYNANKVLGGETNYELYDYMISLGYKHGGFYKLYNGNQPRYTFRINLKNSLEDIYNNLSNSFKKSLKRSEYYNLKIDNEIIPEYFYELIKYNSTKNNFNPHNEKYYQVFSHEMKDNIKYFNIKIKPKELLIKINAELKEQKELLKITKKRKADIQDKIARLEKDIKLFSSITEEEITICSLIITYTNNHVWSSFQGSNELANSTSAISKCYYEAIKMLKKKAMSFLICLAQ